MQLLLCAASAVIAGQFSPQWCPPKIFARSHSFVSRDGARRRWLPKLRILVRRDDSCGSPSGNHVVASARVISPVSGDRGDSLIRWDLFQQVGQHKRIADIACGHTNRADFQCFLVYTEMKLAPQALLWPAMLARVPLSFTLGLDPSAIDQQAERSRSATVRDGDVQCLLTAAQSAEVWDFPVEACQPQQTFDEPGGLPEGHAEQHLHCETSLDRGTAELGLTPPLACRRRMPRHLRIKPD